MKKFLLLLLAIGQFAFSQNLTKEKLKEKLGKELCEDIKDKKFTSQNFEMVLGLSMMKVIKNNKADVEKHYGTDLYGEGGVLEKIGEDLGEQMVTICPDTFEKIYGTGALDKYIDEAAEEMAADTVAYAEEAYEEPNISGKFVTSKLETFQTISVKQDNGSVSNFVMLYEFEGDDLVLQNKLKTNDKLTVYYFEDTLYDPKQKKFIKYNIISEILKE
jgi:hypothetical protein